MVFFVVVHKHPTLGYITVEWYNVQENPSTQKHYEHGLHTGLACGKYVLQYTFRST